MVQITAVIKLRLTQFVIFLIYAAIIIVPWWFAIWYIFYSGSNYGVASRMGEIFLGYFILSLIIIASW